MTPTAIGLKSCRIAVRNERNQRLKQENLQPVIPISQKKPNLFYGSVFFLQKLYKITHIPFTSVRYDGVDKKIKEKI
jgi:hypothetical protein